MAEKITTLDMELAVAEYFNPRVNIIVPNISWSMFSHECDLLILTPSGYAYEVEIKVSLSDLKNDGKKHNPQHYHEKISRLYFSIPSKLIPYQNLIPDHAGIIEVNNGCSILRQAKVNHDYRFSDRERLKCASLGTMRIWTLKRKLRNERKLNHYQPKS